jgi:hypothetical protein
MGPAPAHVHSTIVLAKGHVAAFGLLTRMFLNPVVQLARLSGRARVLVPSSRLGRRPRRDADEPGAMPARPAMA